MIGKYSSSGHYHQIQYIFSIISLGLISITTATASGGSHHLKSQTSQFLVVIMVCVFCCALILIPKSGMNLYDLKRFCAVLSRDFYPRFWYQSQSTIKNTNLIYLIETDTEKIQKCPLRLCRNTQVPWIPAEAVYIETQCCISTIMYTLLSVIIMVRYLFIA